MFRKRAGGVEIVGSPTTPIDENVLIVMQRHYLIIHTYITISKPLD
jgi:hypothetical protein